MYTPETKLNLTAVAQILISIVELSLYWAHKSGPPSTKIKFTL